MFNWYYPKCKKCGSSSNDLKNVSPICRGDKTIQTGINNQYHFFGYIPHNKNNKKNCCIIC